MNRIPKIIHQVWSGIDEPLPKHFKTLGESWKSDYPEWEYVVWDNQKMNDFIQSNYPEYWELYQAFPYNLQRWDVIRYLILDKIGGMMWISTTSRWPAWILCWRIERVVFPKRKTISTRKGRM